MAREALGNYKKRNDSAILTISANNYLQVAREAWGNFKKRTIPLFLYINANIDQ